MIARVMRLAVWRALAIGLLLAWSLPLYAQEATLSGTVTDDTGAVLPGVSVTATHVATGNTFEAVTDGRGVYRIPARVGVFRMTAALSGFAQLSRANLELLAGQEVVANFKMSPGAIAESITVTGESPLINTTGSQIGGNVDPRQMAELPVNGRNFMNLTLLAAGSRANAIGEAPVDRENGGTFQLNVDGQQVSQQMAGSGFGEPRYSRDSIAEFEFVSNRFDATQGRSAGVQVNVISKSGSNVFGGSMGGYFRDDKLNAKDFVANRVLPYSDQQISSTFGGPIRKDKMHFFGNYEYEHEPQSFVWNSPFTRFNIPDVKSDRKEHKAGVRVDTAFSSRTRLMVRGNVWTNKLPWDPRWAGGATLHPSAAPSTHRESGGLLASLTSVFGAGAVNEIKAGYAKFLWGSDVVVDKGLTIRGAGLGGTDAKAVPSVNFSGYTIGPSNRHFPQQVDQRSYSINDQVTMTLGAHGLKVGGEYIQMEGTEYLCSHCAGWLDAQGGPIPANVQDLFPVWNDVSTWNVAPLTPIVRAYRIAVASEGGKGFTTEHPRKLAAGWLQDDWRVTKALTLNLGVRYDFQLGVYTENDPRFVLPILPPDHTAKQNYVVPRLGFAWSVGDRTVIRGGYGRFSGDAHSDPNQAARAIMQQLVVVVFADGRPNFAADPFNIAGGGHVPTFEEALARTCAASTAPDCIVRDTASGAVPHPRVRLAYSHQASIGLQRQLGPTMSFDADWVFTGGRDELYTRNINLTYNPATGRNYPIADASHRPWPEWGTLSQAKNGGWSNYTGLQTAFTKRFSQRWQASGTYTWSWLRDGTPPAAIYGVYEDQPLPFPIADDLLTPYGLAVTDQRHRAVVNGIWQVGHGFQASGLYQFGSGQRLNSSYGGDLSNTGGASGRLRPDGSIVPRNSFVGRPIHRVDLRLLQSIPVVKQVKVEGMFEVYNLFNHANYGSYVTQEVLANYGAPTFNTNIAYQPRVLQLGFRVQF